MAINLEKVKSLATMYLLLLVIGTSLFAILVDYKALEKKKLRKDAKICRFIGYAYLIGGIAFFVVAKYMI